MFIFFEIPLILILIIIIGLIGVGVQIASTVAFWIFVIMFAFYWLVFATGFVSSAIVKDSLLEIILSVAICVLGFLISLFLIKTFYCVDEGITTLLAILGGLIIAQIVILIVLLSAKQNKIVGPICILVAFALSVICCMWTIGYSLSYTVKTTVSNVAYYKCVEHETKPGVVPYINRNIYDTYSTDIRKISDEHIIGSYEVGDRLQPAHGVKYFEGNMWEYIYNHTWYSVYTEDGQIGWIPTREIEIYYFRESEDIKNRQEEMLEDNWYGHLPESFLKMCESLFEIKPHRYKCNFAE